MTQATEDQIFTLFKQLPVDKQSEVLDELHNLLENDDGIEVEIIDEDDDA